MKRKQFLRELKEELRKRRDIEVEEVLFYYDELIQDAVDNGESEDIFIANLGSVREIARRIEDDEEFISEVKVKNKIFVDNALANSVKIIGYIIVAFVAFILGVTAFSLFISGATIVFAGIVKILAEGYVDVYGYIAILGLVMIGISLSLFSIAIVKWFVNQIKPALLSIFRNTKGIFERRGK
ncbi:MAG TPA: DUF1700 domain-containing protein [Bacillota bacterium]|nr:DUF1700 domain-containing protein [Bacillota bacterium]